ncbi:MAG TPA: putative 2OG-Fe(II) oxygenase [Allosphingosinicella sp.]
MTPASAAAAAQTLRATDPADSTAAFNAAIDALNHGLEPEGLELLEAARRLAPRDPRLWQMAGLLHRNLDEFEAAIAMLGEAARLAPGDALVAHTLARAHLEAGLPSIHLFQAARRLAPANTDILEGLVAAVEEQVGPTAAIEMLEMVLGPNPTWLPGLETLMRLRWMCGDKLGFTADFDRALAVDPSNIPVWRSLIIALTQANRYDEALEVVLRGRAAAGDHLIFDVNEAVARSELGQLAAAEPMFERLAAIEDGPLQVRRVRHFLRTGRPAEAAGLAERMTKTPNGMLFWPYLSIAWRQTRDPRWEWLEGDPRFVGVYDLGLAGLDALAERLRALHRTTHQPLEQSLRGGTQTQGNLFSRIDPEIRSLRAAIVAAVEAHVAQLPPPEAGHPLLDAPRESRVRFAGSWSVRLPGGGHHANHIHPAGWFSSAFYVALPAEIPEPAGWLTLGVPQAELGIDLPPIRRIEPKPGRLILFPSTLWHGTVPFEAGERLTVAFDVARPF